jgi:hypothetical protein
MEPTVEQEAGYREWVASRPDAVRIVAERFDPWSLYRIKSSNHKVTIVSFGVKDDGEVSLTVNVGAQFNLVMFERNVFGIDPDDLEPCDVPSEDEPAGAMLTQGQVEGNIDALRVMARPDLWVMEEHGKAIRK